MAGVSPAVIRHRIAALLAVDESALERMRALITDSTNGDRVDARYRPDVDLVVGEIERVRERLDHWLSEVDDLS